MRSRFQVLIAVFATGLCATASSADQRPVAPFNVWGGTPPGARGTGDVDIPTLTPFWPDTNRSTGAAMIVCPGGGYQVLAPHEGEAYARWLNDLGIAAFVLKYRLVKDGYHLPEIYRDAARSVRVIRYSAKEWGLNPERIGIIGSSAGGHLSATLLTHNDNGAFDSADPIGKVSSRPDLGILCYAFILFDKPGNPARQERFLGPNPTQDQIRTYSPALNVSANTPPCFVWQTVEDKAVPVENALAFADALSKAGVPYELHLYQKGQHGIGLGSSTYDPAKLHAWARECASWLAAQGFARREMAVNAK